MSNTEYTVSNELKAETKKFKSAINSAINLLKRYDAVAKKIDDVQLQVDDKELEATVKRAEQAIDQLDGQTAKVDVDADIIDLEIKKDEAIKELNKLDDMEATPEIDLEKAKFDAEIDEINAEIDRLENEKATIEVDADTSRANAKISQYERAIEFLDNKSVRTAIDLSDRLFVTKFEKTKRELNNLDGKKVHTAIEVDDKLATANVVTFKAILRSIPNKVRTRLDVDAKKSESAIASISKAIDSANNTWDTIAKKIRTVGTIFQNMIQGVMLSNISLLVPVIASLVPVLMAVANAIGVVAGGAAGLGVAFGVAYAGVGVFAGMAVSALKMLKDGTLQATAETRRYQSALESLKSAWQSIIKQNQAEIFNTLANGIDTAKVALAGLTPFISGVSKGIEQASAKTLEWAKTSQVAQRFFQMMGTTGVTIFNNMLSAAGQFGSGIISVLTQLAPLAEWVSSGFKKMGAAFNQWAQSTEGQNAIKSFIEYTKQNLPLIGQIFGNVFKGIFNLMKAFAPNTHLVLQGLAQMSNQFAAWSARIAESDGFKKFIEYVQENGPKLISLLGNIISIIINVATAMAPFASAVLNIAIAITDFVQSLTAAHPAIGVLLGLITTLAGVFMTLGPPIFGAIDFITSFAMAITGAETAMAAFSAIGGAITTGIEALGAAFLALNPEILIIVAVVGALVAVLVWLWNTNESVRNALMEAWQVISQTIGGAIQAIIQWFQQLLASIMVTIQPILPMLQQFAEFVNQFLGVIVVAVINQLIITFQLLWTSVSVVFTAIGAIISAVVQIIIGLFTAFIQLLTGDFSGALLTLQNTFTNVLQTIWGAVQSIFTQISNFIFASLNRILGTSISSWSQIWSSTVSFLSQIWSSVTSWFSRTASSVANGMRQGWSYVMSIGAQWVSAIINALAQFVSSVISGFVNVIAQVQSGMNRAVSAVRSFVGQFVSAGLQMMAGLARGIVSGASHVISSAINVAKNAISAVKSALGIHSPSRVFKGIGEYTMEGMHIGMSSEGRRVISTASAIASRLSDSFNASLNTPNIGDALSNATASVNAQVQHTHNIKANPNQKTVRVEFDVNNDALTSIVNGQNADRNSIFTF